MSQNTARKKRLFFLHLIKWVFIFGIFVALVIAGFLYIKIKPYWERAQTYDLSLINNVELPSIIYDKNNQELGRIFVENRSPVKLADVSPKFIQALIAGEDQRFYEHDGVDYIGLVRVAYLLVKDREATQGGSTLTQQLAKNAYRLPEEADERKEEAEQKKIVQFFVSKKFTKDKVLKIYLTLERKIIEIFLARRITQEFSKNEVLEFYMNRIIFGSGYYGIRSASLGYFGKEPSELNWQESASLVGAIKSPRNFGPTRELNLSAREQVFKRLRDEAIITELEYQELSASPHTLNPKPLKRQTSHLYVKILEELQTKLTTQEFNQGGFHIYTSIDKTLQDLAQKTLTEHLFKIEQHGDYTHPLYQNHTGNQIPEYLQGSILIQNQETGEIITYIGGRDFNHSQYDFIESGKRPLGSAFTPFIYAAYLNGDGTLSERIIDEPLDNRFIGIQDERGILGAWGQEQAESVYQGNISLYESLIKSKISSTVTLGIQYGVANILNLSAEWGFDFSHLSSDEQTLPKWLSGQQPISLAQAINNYQALLHPAPTPASTESTQAEAHIINKVSNAEHHVLYSKKYESTKSQAPLNLVSQQINQALYDQVFHPHGYLSEWKELWNPYRNQDFSVKTSTTANFSDAWTIGSLAPYSCGIWVGFFNGNETIYPNAFGKDLSGPIWNSLMQYAAKNYNINPRKVDYTNRITVCSRTSLETMNLSFQEQVCKACRKHDITAPTYAFYLNEKSSSQLKTCSGDIDYNMPALSFYQLDFINSQLSIASKTQKSATSYLPYSIKTPLLSGKDPYQANQTIPNLHIFRDNELQVNPNTKVEDILMDSPFSQEGLYNNDKESILLNTQELKPF